MARPTTMDRLDTLRRRRDHLAARISRVARGDLSYDRAELSALNWAISTLERAHNLGLLAELETYSVSLLDRTGP